MDIEILLTHGASDFISSIPSLPMLCEMIIFNVPPLAVFSQDVEEALCGLVNTDTGTTVTVKFYLIRQSRFPGTICHPDELKFWFDRNPKDAKEYSNIHEYDCVIKFPDFAPTLRRACRVVLMEERKEGTVVVVHDSRNPSIHCDCGRGKAGTEEGLR